MIESTITTELRSDWPLPVGWLVGIFLLVAGISVGLVVHERLPSKRTWILGALRVAGMGLLFLLFGGWQIHYFESEPSDLILLVDRSRSMSFPAGDSADRAGQTRFDQLRDWFSSDPSLQRLGERYRVRTFSVGAELRQIEAAAIQQMQPSDWESRQGEAIRDVIGRQRGRSTAAIVLLSDGVVTNGIELDAVSDSLVASGIPLWSVGFGGDQAPLDIAIEEILADRRAFVGDEVSVQVIVRASGVGRGETRLQLKDRQSERVIETKTLPTASLSAPQTVPFLLPITKTGTLEYEVVAETETLEIEQGNNRRSFTIEVRDEPTRVLLIAEQPSQEFRFLKHLFERTAGQGSGKPLFELTSVLQTGDPRYAAQDESASVLPPLGKNDLGQMDAVIFCDADLDQLGPIFAEQLSGLITDMGLGIVFIAGPENYPIRDTDHSLARLLPAESNSGNQDAQDYVMPQSVQPTAIGATMQALKFPGPISWGNVAPVYRVSAIGALRAGASVLLETETAGSRQNGNQPVVLSQPIGAGEVWMQLTDETFLWQASVGGTNLFESYWMQVVRHLGRIIGLGAGEYRVELVGPEVHDSALPVAFRVYEDRPELTQGAAALEELHRVSQLTGGDLVSGDASASDLIDRLPRGRTVKLRQTDVRSIWNSWLVAAAIVGLLTSEWYLRRRWGLP